jgi:hypothetical protein
MVRQGRRTNPFFKEHIAVDINELLGLEGDALAEALAGLNGEQLAEYETALAAAANDITEDTPESVAQLNKIADTLDAVTNARTTLEAALEQAKQDGAAARARIAGKPESENDDPEAAADPENPDADPAAEPEDPEAAADPAAEPALVAGASGSRIRRMARQTGRAKPSPEVPDTRPRATLTASGALTQSGITDGRIESPEQLGEAVAELLNGMPRTGPARGKVHVASARWNLPEDRRLGRDQAHNDRVFRQALGPKPFLSLPEEALVASGGICAPVNVDYTVPGWSTADRPIRDALPSFQADRGGITYVPPGDIATYADATMVWTEATDANPAGATKPVVQVVCGSPTTVYVDAIPTRLGFGNLTARFAPEQTAANIDLAMSQAARIAENNLLDLIAASCVADLTSAPAIGAMRGLIVSIRQVVAQYRSLHRIPRSVKFTAIFPDWLRDLLVADLAQELAHSQSDYYNALAVADDQIDEYLQSHGINPVYHIDGQDDSVSGGVAQVFGAQTTEEALLTFPDKMVWYIFPEGVFQFLDAGRLDLGVVRDSTLDATNDY